MKANRGRQWAYVGAVLGAAVSISANVAHSYVPPAGAAAGWSPQPGAVAGSVFWPVAVLVALEILARVEWPDGWQWAAVRWLGLTPVGIVAAVVSYRHLSGLLGWYGEDSVTSTLGPLAVDGLMLLASGALLAEPSQRRTAARRRSVPVPVAQPVVEGSPVPAQRATAPSRPSRRPAPELRRPAEVDELLLVGQAVVEHLAREGVPLSRRSLVAGLRARGVAVGTSKAGELLEQLRAA